MKKLVFGISSLIVITGLVLSSVRCQTFKSAEAEVYNADLVIVGGGWSGTLAALKAAETNLKVVVLEKESALGGGTAFLAVNTAWGNPRAQAD
ncbi:MAG: FAD-dependent oxidoreductase, partial [Spirochaetaceae bacterium]|nr:FAD-dependent oxidoreductase [Spirochaetaceae bacterium]